ncbi:unnamed protein product [Rangifer tarandus platyrhynchus]|uniref:Uncharacterized protein n=2 Tax=Rangifer tarandus platyrhynchus TaxID=3082113 RepID=A0ABN8ZCK1_RANTA|nr:unnamed protein product [Rangifer tarandus platyrhynchus]CAI9705807.1 unnamed protein product [Rangifer tarandus platyrhynchus]
MVEDGGAYLAPRISAWSLKAYTLSLTNYLPKLVSRLQEDSGPGKRAPCSLTGQNGWEPGLGSLTGTRAGVGPSLLLLGTVSLEHSALVSEHVLEGPAKICGRSRQETLGCLHTAWLSARRTCCANLGAPENGGKADVASLESRHYEQEWGTGPQDERCVPGGAGMLLLAWSTETEPVRPPESLSHQR